MKFIKAEEFLKQPVEVQKVFIEWWKPSIGDLINVKSPYEPNKLELDCIQSVREKYFTTILDFDYDKKDNGCIPLLTEGQLRQFIEDKTNCKLNVGNIPRIINVYKKELDISYETDLLQAYWKVAIQIAKEAKG